MTQTQITIEILKLFIAFLTPILVLIVGLKISKKIEKNKLDVLKEKEWQVKWAEMFLKLAVDFNDNVTIATCSLFNIQTEKDYNKVNELRNTIKTSTDRISEIDWNIQNYAQFAKTNQKEVLEKQKELMNYIRELISKKKGDLEILRKLQFDYNNAVRNAHSEILKMK